MHAEHALGTRWPERAAVPPARAVPSYGGCCRCRTWAVQWHFYDDPTANQPRPPDGPTEMNSSFKTCLALAASSVLLVACGGGNDGGRIVATGTPEDLVRLGTHTGKALGPVLAR